jgi:hypothetical protein
LKNADKENPYYKALHGGKPIYNDEHDTYILANGRNVS